MLSHVSTNHLNEIIQDVHELHKFKQPLMGVFILQTWTCSRSKEEVPLLFVCLFDLLSVYTS